LVKINNDGTLPSFTTCGGIFRGCMRKFIGGFFAFLDVHTTLFAEFYEIIHAIEQDQKMDFTILWLECDFGLVYAAFTVMTNVHWMFCNRGNTYLNYCKKIRFKISHIFCEGNAYADKLANLVFIHKEYFHWYNKFLSNFFLNFLLIGINFTYVIFLLIYEF